MAQLVVWPAGGAGRILSSMTEKQLPHPNDIAKWLIFKTRRVAERNWQIRARLGPRDETHYVASFKSEAQALEWIASSHSEAWLKERGYGKWLPAPNAP
jgi:hypothetical protein